MAWGSTSPSASTFSAERTRATTSSGASFTRSRILVTALSQFRSAAAITVIGGVFGHSGPAVWAVLPALPDRPKYEMPWRVLSETLGQPVPYWPFPLRIPDLIQAWRPGANAAVAAAGPVLDIYPLRRLASVVADSSPAQRALVNFARTVQSREPPTMREMILKSCNE